VIGERAAIPFRTAPAVARGEAALVRTDPVVGTVAGFILDAALDPALPDWQRPARRCGVVRTKLVTTRTTLLLVRFRFHLMLPSRTDDRQLVAEDARLLAFEGAPANARWLDDAAATTLLAVTADENTAPEFAAATVQRVLDGQPALVGELERRGDTLAAGLLDSHRRVRRSLDATRRGLRVIAQKPVDVLGVYVYLPVTGSVA
jgi:hypothetical protein